MTEFWLVRHGQTDWNVEGRFQGQSDTSLNDTGREQARQLAAQLEGQVFDAIYSSDLARAYETAQILAGGLRMPVQTDTRLREIHLGEWEGLLWSEVNRLYPEEMARRRESPEDFRAPGAETATEVAERVCEAAAEMHALHRGGRVLVVSHGLTLAALACRAQGLSLSQVYTKITGNAEPVVVEWD